MALSKIVTKKSVSNPQENLFLVTFNLSLSADTIEVLNQDFVCEYRTGENISGKVAEVKDRMQEVINRYKTGRVIYDSVQLDNVVSLISGGLIL
jgi:hypothetical protein